MPHPNAARQVEATPATAKYDVAVVYRVSSMSSKSKPPIFAEDKLKLVEFCLKSFKASLGNLRAKMWVVLTAPPEYEKLFRAVWPQEDLVVLNVGKIGNPRSLQKQIDILTTQTDAELVFAAEDDYFYLPGKFQSAVEFLRGNPDTSFISLYDHPDNYVIPFQQFLPPAKAQKSGGLYWYSRAATTHTFLTRKATLQKCRKVFRAFFWGSDTVWGSDTDTAHWLALTKTKIFNLPMFLKSLVMYRYWAACMVLAWIFRWRQILFGERYTLWTPSPSIATHMIAGLEAPGVDWRKEFDRCLPEG